MLYGIKYEYNKQGRNLANQAMQKIGSAFYVVGTCEFYLNNLFSALVVARGLNKSHDKIKYRVFKLSPEEEAIVPKEKIASSAEEFKALVDKRSQEARKKLQELVEQVK